jgi:CDP-6-deoxy-D-xylo-4-hexulose-3-dehydrase
LRPLEIEGAIGLVQLKKLNTFIDQRRSNAKVLRKLLAENQNFHLQVQQDFGSWMEFAILIKNQKIMRKDVIQILEDNKFETRPIVTGNFLLQPVIQTIKDSCIIDQSYVNAEYVDSQGFMIANHGKDLFKELNLLARILNSINA